MADVLSVIADVLKQDKQQKREQAKIMKEVQKKLKEKGSEEVAEEEGDKEDYMKFFAGKLKKYGVKSPAELSDEDKKKFFNEIEKDWKHDSSEEVEVKEKDLGKRVKSRMEAEDDEEDEEGTTVTPAADDELEDEDEAPVGDQDEPETEPEDAAEPSEDQIDKIADLVVQKLKDKADEEEEEEQEPDSTEAEGGKEEEIDTKPKVENLNRNPHHRGMWEDALKKVYTIESAQDTPQQLDEHCGVCDEQGLEEKVELSEEVADIMIRKGVGKMNKQQIAGKVMTNARKFGLDASVNGEFVRISGSKKKVNDYLAVIIGRSSSGDATQIDGHDGYPSIDKGLTKDLKTAHGGIGPGLYRNLKKEETIKEEICPECGQELPCDCGYVKEGNDKPIEDAAKKVQHNWKRMSTKDKVKFKDKMDDLASKNRVSDADLEEILDDYGLTEGKESIGMTFLRKHYSKDNQ